MDFVTRLVESEMKEEINPKIWQNRFWTAWFYFYYFLELEWERYTPFFHPVFAATLLHHALMTLELSGVCISGPY